MTKYEAFINYAFETSDFFSLEVNLWTIEKEDKNDAGVKHYLDVADALNAFLIHENRVNKTAAVRFYACNEETKKIVMQEYTRVYDWNGRCCPDDLYFYRNTQKKSVEKFCDPNSWGKVRIYKGIEPWYYSLDHEEQDWLRTITEEDIRFFAEIGLEIQPIDRDEWRILWDDTEQQEAHGYCYKNLFEFDDIDPDDIGFRFIDVK